MFPSTLHTVPTGTRAQLRGLVTESGSNALLLTGRDGALLRSTDVGLHWRPVDTGTLARFKGLSFHRNSGNLVVFGDRLVWMQRLAP